MGTFGGYTGNMYISEDKREEFTKCVMKLLVHGGMMQFEKVSMFGQEIVLLKPVELNKKGYLSFHFNYFDDDGFETARYDANDAIFGSGKIGSAEYSFVIMAVYALYELYDSGPGVIEINGDTVSLVAYTGWINHVLGTNFTIQKRFRLWEQFEKFCLKCLEQGYRPKGALHDCYDFVPKYMWWAMGGTEFSDICYVTNGTDTLQPDEIISGTYPDAIYQCKQALLEFFKNNSEDESIAAVWNLVRSERLEREQMIQKSDMGKIAEWSLRLPARVIVYLTAELNGLEFWQEWSGLHNDVYTDEIIPQYASDELIKERKEAIEQPVLPLRTSDFLHNDGYFTFWDTPDELKGKPNYYLSDDDRVFWWDGTDDVILSDEMKAWMKELAKMHKNIMSQISDVSMDSHDFLKEFMQVLNDVNQSYKRIYCFQTMFYEFLEGSHHKQREYLAAVRLLEKLAEDYMEDGKIIEKVNNWTMASRNVTHNAGRIKIKRYLGIMANRRLREEYFGF